MMAIFDNTNQVIVEDDAVHIYVLYAEQAP